MRIDHAILAALKRLLRRRGMTYAQLAVALGVSEATLKRTFSKGGLSLSRLTAICEVIGVDLQTLAVEAQEAQPPLSELTEAIESALVQDPPLLLALYLCLNRWRQEEVLAAYRFTPAEWTRLLARLDRLGVIELLPGNRVRLRTARNFRWRQGGPMERFFMQRLLHDFFGGSFQGPDAQLLLLSGMISPDSVGRLAERIQEVANEFDRLMARDAALPVARRVGVSMVLARRSWQLGLFDALWREPAGQSAGPV